MKIYKAYAKVNIFLKITGVRDNYHEILSRFMRVNSLYDELSFVLKDEEEFKIIGDFSCTTEQNTIYKAYFALKKATQSEALEKLMRTYGVEVKKSIPAFAGLGGGSSDAATYLKMCNEVLHLGLSLNELATIGLEVGADVPFFIYDYNSANVSGIGEIVEEFMEAPLHVEIITPDIECDTGAVYRAFRDNYRVDIELAQKMTKLSSKELLNSYDDATLNDLFGAALKVCPELEKHRREEWFFSGSGSSFFKVKSI